MILKCSICKYTFKLNVNIEVCDCYKKTGVFAKAEKEMLEREMLLDIDSFEEFFDLLLFPEYDDLTGIMVLHLFNRPLEIMGNKRCLELMEIR